MGIYIRGLDMPESCFYCPFRERANPDECVCLAMNESFEKNPLILGARHKDCPLVPVPPHGRLIDADTLRQSIKESIDECHKWADEVEGGEMFARVSQTLGTFVECSLRVKAAPTIIPASEDE